MIFDYFLMLFSLILIGLLSYRSLLKLGRWLEIQLCNIKNILEFSHKIISSSDVDPKQLTTVILQQMGLKNTNKKPIYLNDQGLVIFVDTDRVNIVKMDTELWGATIDHRIDAKFNDEMITDNNSICNHLKHMEDGWYDVTPTAGLSFDHTALDLGAEEIRVYDGNGYHHFNKTERVHWPLPQEDEFES